MRIVNSVKTKNAPWLFFVWLVHSCLVHTQAWRLTFNSVLLKRRRLTTTDLSLPGRVSGADEFLPMMTYVLAQCDIPQLDNEILYMMELLDPSQLNGEGTPLLSRPQDGLFFACPVWRRSLLNHSRT